MKGSPTTAAATPWVTREALFDQAGIIALALPTGATGDNVAAIRQADVRVPLAAVLLDQAETVWLLPKTAPWPSPWPGAPTTSARSDSPKCAAQPTVKKSHARIASA